MSCKVGIYEKDEEESKDDRQYHLKIEVKKLQRTCLRHTQRERTLSSSPDCIWCLLFNIFKFHFINLLSKVDLTSDIPLYPFTARQAECLAIEVRCVVQTVNIILHRKRAKQTEDYLTD